MSVFTVLVTHMAPLQTQADQGAFAEGLSTSQCPEKHPPVPSPAVSLEGGPQGPENSPVSPGPRAQPPGSREENPAPPRSPVCPGVSGVRLASGMELGGPLTQYLCLLQKELGYRIFCVTHMEPQKSDCPRIYKAPLCPHGSI